MSRRYGILVALAALAVLSCEARNDIAARYNLERLLWAAQLHERKINISFIRASQQDLELAIGAFENVIAYDPLEQDDTSGWAPEVVADIRRIRIASMIALANLYFIREDYSIAGELYRNTLELPLTLESSLDARLGVARSFYLAGEDEAFERYCRDLFRMLRDSDEFWSGKFELGEVFVNLPLVLVRTYRERGQQEEYERFSREAREFYERMIRTWPASEMALRASRGLVSLRLAREEWEEALVQIDELRGMLEDESEKENMLLLKGEILAHAMDRTEAGEAVFNSLVRGGTDPFAVQAARLNIGVLRIRNGQKDKGMGMLRALESQDDVDPEVASKAMLIRALQLEKDSMWDESLPILRRLVRLYPYSQAATEAPLITTRHYIESGDMDLARRSLERGSEYYLSLMDRASKFSGDRLAVGDMLIENYLMLGEAREVAELLGASSTRWDDATTAGGMYRSALIYSEVLDDTQGAVRVLEKCIELFPNTRYAKIARRQLDRLEG